MKKKMSEFLKEAYATGRVRPVEEAFDDYSVNEEDHKGDINYFLSEGVEIYGKYSIGDIVFVEKFKYENDLDGSNHLFVIIEENNIAIPIEYMGLILSSQIHKQTYESNILIEKDEINHLKKDSIIKTDRLYQILEQQILFKIGMVELTRIDEYKNMYLKKQE